jgi:hypothetical protein
MKHNDRDSKAAQQGADAANPFILTRFFRGLRQVAVSGSLTNGNGRAVPPPLPSSATATPLSAASPVSQERSVDVTVVSASSAAAAPTSSGTVRLPSVYTPPLVPGGPRMEAIDPAADQVSDAELLEDPAPPSSGTRSTQAPASADQSGIPTPRIVHAAPSVPRTDINDDAPTRPFNAKPVAPPLQDIGDDEPTQRFAKLHAAPKTAARIALEAKTEANRQRHAELAAQREAAASERARVAAERKAVSAQREQERQERVNQAKLERTVTQDWTLEKWMDQTPVYLNDGQYAIAEKTPWLQMPEGPVSRNDTYQAEVKGPARLDDGTMVLRSPDLAPTHYDVVEREQARMGASLRDELKTYTRKATRKIQTALAATTVALSAATALLSGVFNHKAVSAAVPQPASHFTVSDLIPPPPAVITVATEKGAHDRILSVTDRAGNRVVCQDGENPILGISEKGNPTACANALHAIQSPRGQISATSAADYNVSIDTRDRNTIDCSAGVMDACNAAANAAISKAPDTIVERVTTIGGITVMYTLEDQLNDLLASSNAALNRAPSARFSGLTGTLPDLPPPAAAQNDTGLRLPTTTTVSRLPREGATHLTAPQGAGTPTQVSLPRVNITTPPSSGPRELTHTDVAKASPAGEFCAVAVSGTGARVISRPVTHGRLVLNGEKIKDVKNVPVPAQCQPHQKWDSHSTLGRMGEGPVEAGPTETDKARAAYRQFLNSPVPAGR